MACKDKTTGTWVAQWYEVDMYGKKKRRKKRGFKTMREAKLYENERTLKEQGDMNMLLKDFMEQYFEDKQNELKERSVRSKKQMMERHVIPYFGDMKMCDITAPQIIKWQNEMYKKLAINGIGVFDMSREDCKSARMQECKVYITLQSCNLEFLILGGTYERETNSDITEAFYYARKMFCA